MSLSSDNKKVKKPKGPLSKVKILEAMAKTKSNCAAARYCGVALVTYRRYAKMYLDEDGVSLYEKHKNIKGAGIPKLKLRKSFAPNLMDILEGRVNTIYYSIKTIKQRIIKEGFLREQCSCCGFDKRRAYDDKVPLILNFKDGNKRNWRLENLEFLCYNCFFLNITDLFTENQKKAMEDYAWHQTTPIDFELPKSSEEEIKKTINLENKYVEYEKDPDEFDLDYGDDLISFRTRKKI